MKYVFFGTPRFAEVVLRKLVEAKMPPVALVCNPDRPVGRKKIVTPPPTKIFAEKARIMIFQPEKLDEKFIGEIKGLRPDFFVVAAYAKILPKEILDIPRLGALGVHPSCLPQFRGASPIQSAILAGEVRTGTTIYLMDEKMDHGPIIAQGIFPQEANRPPADHLPYFELEDALAKLGAELLIKTAPDFLAGKIKPQTQDESRATYTKKFKTEDGFVDGGDLSAAERGDAAKASIILRKINALNPEPGAWTVQNGKRVKLLKATVSNGRLMLLETQKEGGKAKSTTRIA